MTKTTLKLSLLGALLSLGVFAAGDVQTKRMKDNAEFIEKAAMFSKTQVNLSELAISQSTTPAVKDLAQQVIDDHEKAFDSLKEVASEGGYALPFESIGTGVSEPSGSAAPAERLDDSESAAEQVGDAAKRAAEDVAETSKSAADDVASATKDASREVTGYPKISQSKDYAKANEKAQKEYNDLAKLSGEKFDKEYLGAIDDSNDKAIKLLEKQSKRGWDANLKGWADETLPTLRQHDELADSVKDNLKSTRPSM